MSHSSQTNNSNLLIKQSSLKISTNRSELIELNQIQLPQHKPLNLKLTHLSNLWENCGLLKEIARFLIYAMLGVVLVSLFAKNQVATIYSISSKNLNEQGVTLNKQVPGIFPALSNDWQRLLTTWNIVLISGKTGSTSYKQDNYQLEFKHNEKKQNILYITKGNCDGHIIMNWQVYEHNVYLTPFLAPKGSMTIPNLPKDQQCIKQKSDLINLLHFSTIWTISEENSRNSLFLLIEQVDKSNQKNNYVLIADQHKKV